MDRRLLKSNGRVAHVSEKGRVEATRFVDGERCQVSSAVTDLCDGPAGNRDRQLLRGDMFVVLETMKGWAFGFSEKDGYAGWIEPSDLADISLPAPTHRIATQLTYGKSTPGLKAMGRTIPLSFGSSLLVIEERDGWAQVAWERGAHSRDIFVPSQHLTVRDTPAGDPVAIAELFLGSPYLWGGNSAFGIDCSGLVQAALLTCGIPCPGDSDLQEAAFADATGRYERGDLLFWKGHVAMVVDADTLIHANAHHMAVAYERIDAAIARIEKQGDGPVTSHKRPTSKDMP